MTQQVVITGERRRHYLSRHPEIETDEPLLIRALRAPDEVHRNERDERIAIVYKAIGADEWLRIALWLSNVDHLKHSVHSARRARQSEIERGRRRGKMVWKK